MVGNLEENRYSLQFGIKKKIGGLTIGPSADLPIFQNSIFPPFFFSLHSEFKVPAMMTFVSWAGGNIECGFGGNTFLINRHQRLIFDELGPWRLLWVLDGRKFVRCPNTFRPLTNETCWKIWTRSRGQLSDMELWSCNMLEKHRKWKMELTCDHDFRNQSSCCLFRTSASIVRLSN